MSSSSRRCLQRLLLSSIGLASAGCGQAIDIEPAGRAARQQVVRGLASSSDQNAVVLILPEDRRTWCTGVVVAPTLVLTTRTCVFEVSEDEGPFYLRCLPTRKGSPVFRAKEPARLLVTVGTGNRELQARGFRIYSGAELEECENDLALLEVDTPLTPAPLALRLDSEPRRHEKGILVGWGLSEEHRSTPQADRQQHELEVLAVGPSAFQLPGGQHLEVAQGSFIAGEGACFRDEGGPFISDSSNAVIGILSILEPAFPNAKVVNDDVSYCIGAHGVFRSLAAQSGWIRDAFVRTNQAPWLEGKPPPAALGQSCARPGDCSSEVCKSTTGGAQFCSQACSLAPCPADLQCVGSPGERWCVPARVANDADESAGCKLGRAHARARLAYLLVLGLGMLRKRRRLSKITCSKLRSVENSA